MTDAEETVETEAQAKKRQTAATPVPTVRVGGSGSSGAEHSHSHSSMQTEQRVVVPSEVAQDTGAPLNTWRLTSQLRMKREVREVQGVSLDADERELQRLARDSAEYNFRDKQVEVSDDLIDEVGALLTESGGAEIIEICSTARFAAGLRPGFAVDLCENKSYGQHEGESCDLSKAGDVKELFEMTAFERPVIVTGSPLYSVFSTSEPFHRHIVVDGGIAKMASAYAPELVNIVLRVLRQQMLDDGWISDLELQFAGPSPSEPVFDLKENAATQWADEFDDRTGAQLPGKLVHAGKMEEIRG